MENNLPKDIEFLTKWMDDRFELFGFRFGLNFFIDLIPEIGDIVTTVIALYIFSLAVKYRIPVWVKILMFMNVMVYFLIGLIPWLGDLFGVWWKPNRRNARLLERHFKAIDKNY